MTDWIEESVGYSDIGVGSDVIPLDSETGLPDNHVLTIRERRITVDENILIQNNVKTDTITLDLDAEWDDVAEIIVIFTDMRLQSVEKIYEAPAVAIPASAQDEVGTLEVSVVGYNADHTMRLVTVYAPAMFEVIRSGKITGSITTDEADDMLAQLASAAEAATTAAAAANAAASSVNEAVEDAETAVTAANEAVETATQAAQQVADAMEGLEDATNAAETASANATSAALSAQAAAQAAQQAAESATDNVLRGYVSETDVASADEAWDRSPLELKVYGNTRQNLWSNDWETYTSNGMIVEENPDGTIHVDASQATGNPAERRATSYALKPGASYIACADKPLGNTGANSFFLQFYNSSGTRLQSIAFGYTDNGLDILNATFVVPDEASYTLMTVYSHDVAAGINDGDYRVMLYEAEPSENLWVNSSGTISGVTCTPNADGSVTLSGTASGNVSMTAEALSFTPGATYTAGVDVTMESNGTSSRFFVEEFDSSGSRVAIHNFGGTGQSFVQKSVTFETAANAVRMVCTAYIASGETVSGTYKVMLNEGSTAFPWEPPAGYPLEPWCPPGIHSVGELMAHERNLWVNPESKTNGGLVYTANADGTFSIDATDATGTPPGNYIDGDFLKPDTTYTAWIDAPIGSSTNNCIQIVELDGNDGSALKAYLFGYDNVTQITFTTSSSLAKTRLMVYAHIVSLGINSGTYRVMLNEGSTAMPWVPPSCESAVQVVTAGKNLLERLGPSLPHSTRGLTFSDNGDGGIRVVGTATDSAHFDFWDPILKRAQAVPAGTYTVSLVGRTDGIFLTVGTFDDEPGGSYTNLIGIGGVYPQTAAIDRPAYLRSFISVTSGATVDAVVYPQLELGSEATVYEPPNIATTPIPLDGNVLSLRPDGVRSDLTISSDGSASITERAFDVVFDGDEKWRTEGTYATTGGGYYGLMIEPDISKNIFVDDTNSASENFHFASLGGAVDNTGRIGYGNGLYSFRLRPYEEDAQNLANFKSWIASHPQHFLLPKSESGYSEVLLDAVTLPALAPTWSMWVQPNANGVPATLSVEYERNVTTAIQNLEALCSGSVIFIGEGVPTDAVQAREGDRYLDETTGKIYELVEVEE